MVKQKLSWDLECTVRFSEIKKIEAIFLGHYVLLLDTGDKS